MKKMNKVILFLAILFSLVSCKLIRVNNESNFFLKNDSVNLYVFIGQKISVIEFDPNLNTEQIIIDSITGDSLIYTRFVMDNGFNAKYKVLKNVFNDLKTDTINFVAYDHYGRPGFENYEYVMLYISLNEAKDNYYHQKYQFDPVKKTKKGYWKGIKLQSIKELFNEKRDGVLKARGLF